MSSVVDWSEYQLAGSHLAVPPCFIKAVAMCESNAKGFTKDDRIVLRFEKHIFKRELKKVMPFIPDDIKYVQGSGFDAYTAAYKISPFCAKLATSWGMFQIMGFNYGYCGYNHVDEMVEDLQRGETTQIRAFVRFVQSQKLEKFMRDLDFAAFAKRYNGPNYAQNSYDTKLKRFYEQCQNESIN